MPTLIPAYGRDYKSKKAVQTDWDAGKDFLTQSIDIGFDQYINKQDAENEGLKTIMIRYQNKTKIVGVL